MSSYRPGGLVVGLSGLRFSTRESENKQSERPSKEKGALKSVLSLLSVIQGFICH